MADASIRDAAILAGCPEKSASQAGSRLEKHPNVIAYLARLKENESDNSEVAGRDAPPPGATGMGQFFDDPRDMLKHAMNNTLLEPKIRIQAAVALLPYEHKKLGETGKKEEQEGQAKTAAQGRFAPAPPPSKQLKLVK